MEYRKQNNGWETFLEHWGCGFVAFFAVITSLVLNFFIELSGTPFMWFLAASFASMIAGGGLIVYAKFPTYRRRQFFTFGAKSVSESLQGYYRWGWRIFLFGLVLSLCLLLTHP